MASRKTGGRCSSTSRGQRRPRRREDQELPNRQLLQELQPDSHCRSQQEVTGSDIDFNELTIIFLAAASRSAARQPLRQPASGYFFF